MHYLLLNELHLVWWMFTITLWFLSLGMSSRRIYLLCNPSGNLRLGWSEECVVFKDLLLALQEDVTFRCCSVSWNSPQFQWHLKKIMAPRLYFCFSYSASLDASCLIPCTFNFFKCPVISFCFAVGDASILQIVLLGSETWEAWWQTSPVETSKTGIGYSVCFFPHILGH